MPQYSVATTKDKLSSLIDKALAGEEVIVTRHGKPTVALRAVGERAEPARTMAEWMEWLSERRKQRVPLGISAAGLVRRMRDEGAH